MKKIDIYIYIMITNFLKYNKLNERVDDYNLYHFTDINSLEEILEDGWLYTVHDKYNGNKSLSTTRNKNFKWLRNNIRITFDKRELSNHYKIKPYHWFNDRHGVDYRSGGDNTTPHNQNIPANQYEERVISDSPIPIKYIKDIDIIGKATEKELKIVNKFKKKINESFFNYDDGGKKKAEKDLWVEEVIDYFDEHFDPYAVFDENVWAVIEDDSNLVVRICKEHGIATMIDDYDTRHSTNKAKIIYTSTWNNGDFKEFIDNVNLYPSIKKFDI